MTQLPEKTKRTIAQDTGIPFDEIADMDWEEIDRRIEQKIGKKLNFSRLNRSRVRPRGSVLLNLNRLIFGEDVENRLTKIK